jgi:hypothetical protein
MSIGGQSHEHTGEREVNDLMFVTLRMHDKDDFRLLSSEHAASSIIVRIRTRMGRLERKFARTMSNIARNQRVKTIDE